MDSRKNQNNGSKQKDEAGGKEKKQGLSQTQAVSQSHTLSQSNISPNTTITRTLQEQQSQNESKSHHKASNSISGMPKPTLSPTSSSVSPFGSSTPVSPTGTEQKSGQKGKQKGEKKETPKAESPNVEPEQPKTEQPNEQKQKKKSKNKCQVPTMAAAQTNEENELDEPTTDNTSNSEEMAMSNEQKQQLEAMQREGKNFFKVTMRILDGVTGRDKFKIHVKFNERINNFKAYNTNLKKIADSWKDIVVMAKVHTDLNKKDKNKSACIFKLLSKQLSDNGLAKFFTDQDETKKTLLEISNALNTLGEKKMAMLQYMSQSKGQMFNETNDYTTEVRDDFLLASNNLGIMLHEMSSKRRAIQRAKDKDKLREDGIKYEEAIINFNRACYHLDWRIVEKPIRATLHWKAFYYQLPQQLAQFYKSATEVMSKVQLPAKA